MGNDLLKNYNMEKDPFLTGGFRDLWKIYQGSRKDRKQEVSIFVFEKKSLDKFSKDEKEEIINVLKKEASILIKYKHPKILGIVEPLLEDKYTLAFVSEPIQYTLASWIESSAPSRLEIKLMITELCQVIRFLHDDAHVIHNHITPETIFIDINNHVRLSGLSFSINDPQLGGMECKLPFKLPNAIQNLKYISPEIVYDQKVYYQSDVFSVGMIIYYLLKIHRGDTDRELLNIGSANSIDAYKRSYDVIDNKITKMTFENDDNDVIVKSLGRNPENRPTTKELIEHAWFNDPKLKALRFVENLEGNEAQKNTEFLHKFPKILNMFENKIIEKRFLPCLLNALKMESLIVPALPSIFAICESSQFKVDFELTVWPSLKSLFHMKQIPAAGLYYLLSRISYIGEKISNTEFSSNLLNIICKALDCGVSKIQSVVSDNLLFITKKIDSLAFKNQIYPRLMSILLTTTSISLKVQLLKSLTTLYSMLDQNIINESLLNNLEKIRKSDSTADVCMSIVGIYEEIAKVVSVEAIANKILPNLISILVSGNISKGNFENIMSLVQKYLSRIKKSREKDLTDDVTGGIKDESKDQASLEAQKGSEKDDFLFTFFGGSASSGTMMTTSAAANAGNELDLNILSKEQTTKPKNDSNVPFFDADSFNKKEKKKIFDGIKKNDSNQGTKTNDIFQFNSMGSQGKISASTESFKQNTPVIGNKFGVPVTSSGNSNFNVFAENFKKNMDPLNEFDLSIPVTAGVGGVGSGGNKPQKAQPLNLDSLVSDLPADQGIHYNSNPQKVNKFEWNFSNNNNNKQLNTGQLYDNNANQMNYDMLLMDKPKGENQKKSNGPIMDLNAIGMNMNSNLNLNLQMNTAINSNVLQNFHSNFCAVNQSPMQMNNNDLFSSLTLTKKTEAPKK